MGTVFLVTMVMTSHDDKGVVSSVCVNVYCSQTLQFNVYTEKYVQQNVKLRLLLCLSALDKLLLLVLYVQLNVCAAGTQR